MPGPVWQESRAGVKEESQVSSTWFSRLSGESLHHAITSCDHPFG